MFLRIISWERWVRQTRITLETYMKYVVIFTIISRQLVMGHQKKLKNGLNQEQFSPPGQKEGGL